MNIGESWAYRRRRGETPIKAEIVQLGPSQSRQVRVKMEGGEYPGLPIWVARKALPVPWSQAAAFHQDEVHLAAARQASEVDRDSVDYRAVSACFGAYPTPDGILLGYNVSEGATVVIRDLSEVARNLGLEPNDLLAEPLAFVNRAEEYVGPWALAQRIAVLVARRYPRDVLEEVAKNERKLQEEAIHGHSYDWGRLGSGHIPAERCAETLREWEPVFARVREWCGAEELSHFDETQALRTEVLRLRGLLERAARELDEFGHAHHARRYRKEIGIAGPKRLSEGARSRGRS